MKLLALNPFGTDAYDEAVRAVLEGARHSGTEVVVEHLARGPEFFRYSIPAIQLEIEDLVFMEFMVSDRERKFTASHNVFL